MAQRYFNTEGSCNPEEHYMVRLDERLAHIKKMYVDRKKYFVINRGRQYGKTTTLRALKEYLKEDYIVLSMDFQKLGAEEFSDEATFVHAFSETLMKAFEVGGGNEGKDLLMPLAEISVKRGSRLKDLFVCLGRMCAQASRPVALMIDEVDSASNNQVFLDFLAQLRAAYLERDDAPIFYSVILAGVYDIKNLKLKLRRESEHQYNSPWNIAVKFKVDMSFSAGQIASMLEEYEADFHTGMDIQAVAGEIYQYTSGYPVLVSSICKYIDEEILEENGFDEPEKAWSDKGVEEAVKRILLENMPLFESMIRHLDEYPSMKQMFHEILFQGVEFAYNPYTKEISLACMFGYAVHREGNVQIANRIFEICLYNYFLSEEELSNAIGKKFNLAGVCIPEKHYMVDLTEKVEAIIDDYISGGAYFTINRARQFGKTTLLSALQRKLSAHYLVIRLSFEGVDDGNFDDNASFANMFLRSVASRLIQMGARQNLVDGWMQTPQNDAGKAFDILGYKITDLCRNAGKGIVLLIDEVDKCSDNQVFLNFLGLLRNKYLDMQEGLDVSFQSVVLAGVYDVKNLKLKMRADDGKKYNSPWNIAVDFQLDMRFTVSGTAGMLAEYCADTGAEMDISQISRQIHFYTDGYPFLVSWLCKWMDENCHGEWSRQSVDDAEKELLGSSNTLFGDMIKNIENNHGLYRAASGILLDGLRIPFVKSEPAINLGIMFGIFAEKDGAVAIANVTFETYLYNHMIAGKVLENYAFGRLEKNQFVENGMLNMEHALQKFQEIMKAEYRQEDEQFYESQGRLLFLCFMKPIINGKGSYYVEPETRSHTRMDVVISYGGREHVVELKIWHGEKYRQKGLRQLEEYLGSRNCDKGYLISFNFNKAKKYLCKKVMLENSGKEVYEIVV